MQFTPLALPIESPSRDATPGTMPSHRGYRPDIDGLRAIAVSSVLLFHAEPALLSGGFTGVDIFFVISGFLITGILASEIAAGNFSLARFYARRVKRIFPALAVVLFATLGAGWLFLLADENAALGKHAAGGAGFVANLLLWSEAGYFDAASAAKPLLHLWSLGIEEQFYILWPLMLWGAHALGLRALVLIGAVMALSYTANALLVPYDAAAAFYSPVTRFWELAAGGALALSSGASAEIESKKALREIAAWLGLALCLAAMVLFSEADPFPGWRALLPVVGAVLLIAAGPNTTINRGLLSSRPFVWIGLISYPLYLWHWPLLSFAHIATSGTAAPNLRLGLCALAVALAWLTYRLVETPIRRGSAGTWRVALPLTLVASAGVLGGAILHADGIGSRRVISLSDWGSPPAPANDVSPALEHYLARLKTNPRYVDGLDEARNAAIRWPACHFSKYNQNFSDFEPGMDRCLALVPDKKNVLVIGDSHGGDFYAVLARTHPELNVLQATGASCAPISRRYRNEPDPCGLLIERALRFADGHPLFAVVLAGHWYSDSALLADDIRRLKSAGQTVIVVGHPLQFTTDVSRIIDRRTSNFGFDRYMARFVFADKDGFNDGVRNVVLQEGAMFLDRRAYQCDPACAVLDDAGDLLIRDYGHLTAAGATALGTRLSAERVIERLVAGDATAERPRSR